MLKQNVPASQNCSYVFEMSSLGLNMLLFLASHAHNKNVPASHNCSYLCDMSFLGLYTRCCYGDSHSKAQCSSVLMMVFFFEMSRFCLDIFFGESHAQPTMLFCGGVCFIF